MGTLGKNVRNKKEIIGCCDRSGFLYNLSDMVKQMEWRGNNLQWTGLMVGYNKVDIPNENLKPFKAKPEGIAPPDSRPYRANGSTAPFYGPTLTTQEALRQLMDYAEDDHV